MPDGLLWDEVNHTGSISNTVVCVCGVELKRRVGCLMMTKFAYYPKSTVRIVYIIDEKSMLNL